MKDNFKGILIILIIVVIILLIISLYSKSNTEFFNDTVSLSDSKKSSEDCTEVIEKPVYVTKSDDSILSSIVKTTEGGAKKIHNASTGGAMRDVYDGVKYLFSGNKNTEEIQYENNNSPYSSTPAPYCVQDNVPLEELEYRIDNELSNIKSSLEDIKVGQTLPNSNQVNMDNNLRKSLDDLKLQIIELKTNKNDTNIMEEIESIKQHINNLPLHSNCNSNSNMPPPPPPNNMPPPPPPNNMPPPPPNSEYPNNMPPPPPNNMPPPPPNNMPPPPPPNSEYPNNMPPPPPNNMHPPPPNSEYPNNMPPSIEPVPSNAPINNSNSEEWWKKIEESGCEASNMPTNVLVEDNNLGKDNSNLEVFNIDQNDYTYEDAPLVCKALGAELATMDQVIDAHKKGANWCNYGWSQNQMALFPIQKSFWKEIQSGPEEYRNDCGKPGINGGYISNPNRKYGVNCYGVKPKADPGKVVYLDENSLEEYPELYDKFYYKKNNNLKEKYNKIKEKVKNIDILPFNNNKWGKNSTKCSKYIPDSNYGKDMIDNIDIAENDNYDNNSDNNSDNNTEVSSYNSEKQKKIRQCYDRRTNTFTAKNYDDDTSSNSSSK